MRDPFHDLHHQEAGATSHIRLISEGGSSHARSPEMVCIDSIQATHPLPIETQHTVYRSTTACSIAAPEQNALCSLAAAHAHELDRESIPDVLRDRLERLGSGLSPGARVSVGHPGRVWHISDQDRTFSIRMLAARIAVYRDR